MRSIAAAANVRNEWKADVADEPVVADNRPMWRYLIIVLAAAAFGGLAGTIVLSVISGGTGASNPQQFVLGLSAATLPFTIPGSMMLVGLQAMLAERGFNRARTDMIAAVFGPVAGALVLVLVSLEMAAVGAAYGFCTALALLALQRLVPDPSEVNR